MRSQRDEEAARETSALGSDWFLSTNPDLYRCWVVIWHEISIVWRMVRRTFYWLYLPGLAAGLNILVQTCPNNLKLVPDTLAAGFFVASQIALFLFAIRNRRFSGFDLITLGLTLNLAVTLLNGGWMPVSPETVRVVVPEDVIASLTLSHRLACSKNMLIPIRETVLWLLSDILPLPDWIPGNWVISPGDFLVVVGMLPAAFTFVYRVFDSKEVSTHGRA